MKFAFCALTILSFHCYSKGYIEYLNITSKAEWFFDNNQSDSAVVLFEEAFKTVHTPLYKDVWMYSIIQAKKGRHQKAYSCLKNFFKKKRILESWGGAVITSLFKRDSILKNPRQEKKLTSYLLDSSSFYRLNPTKNAKTIDCLYYFDQYIREQIGNGFDSCWWKLDKDSIRVSVYDKIREIDSSNAEIIVNLISNEDNLDDYMFSGSRFALLLLHFNYKNFIKIESNLVKMIDNGIIDPWDFARAKDRHYLSAGHCIQYLVYPLKATEFDCITKEEIYSNRREIGLSNYYSRPSYNFYIKPYSMMKVPFEKYLEKFSLKTP